jgi:hypothetical protein
VELRTLLTVPAEIEPPALAQLVDFAERPHVDDWSLRAALVRYAQPQPQRVNDVLDLVRRLEWALGQHGSLLQREGTALWQALEDGTTPDDARLAHVVELLGVAEAIDRLGDVLAGWAVDISGERPDAAVDAAIAEIGTRLDALGVPHEQRSPPPRQRT